MHGCAPWFGNDGAHCSPTDTMSADMILRFTRVVDLATQCANSLLIRFTPKL
ncbi:hypothetical protein C7S13_6789 [Burkholderia cepacia]|nr:hypothetical protein [Burkholderia cepacia]